MNDSDLRCHLCQHGLLMPVCMNFSVKYGNLTFTNLRAIQQPTNS